MIVNGGKTNFGYQGMQKKQHSQQDDSSRFQDLLTGSQKKKKPVLNKRTESTPSKKKDPQDGYDDQQQVSRRKETPVRKKEVSSSVQGVGQQRQERLKEGEQPSAQEKSERLLSGNKKFTEINGKSQEVGDSLNLSDAGSKTLEKNKEIFQKETPFEDMIAGIKEQVAQSKTNKPGLATSQVAVASSNNSGKIKLGADFELNDKLETLSLQESEVANSLKGIAKKDSSESQMDQSTSHLDQLLSQYLEQENSAGQTESVAFAEELSQVQGGKEEKIENMQSIIKQARAFVDDGGGSMEIHLQPEGLGKVHLKVAVQDGQVNVEMLADNLAAKKALEEGLFDIKSALEGHKLLVETLKVEMSPDYQKDFSDLSNHMQEQENRDFAEQFLGQFRQEREQKFGGLFDSFKNFQRGPQEPELNLTRNPYADSGKGRSINLVA